MYPVTSLTAASELSEITNPNSSPANFNKYFYDKAIGMLVFYVTQDALNGQGPSPLGSCPGDPACPDASELETYYLFPAQGCINYSVQLNGTYTPGEPRCDEKAEGSIYNFKSGKYALPVPANQNRLVYVVPSGASGNVAADGEILQTTEIATNSKDFHTTPARSPRIVRLTTNTVHLTNLIRSG